MSGDPTLQPAPPRRRVRKRVLIPLVLLGLLLVLFVVLYVRGTRAGTDEVNPSRPADGTVTRLYRAPDGGVYVRCAVVIDAPPRDVWDVVTDYDHQAAFLPYVREMSGEKEEHGRYHVRGVARSRLWGDWPFDSRVTLEEQPGRGEYRASWAEENVGDFRVNRGSWTLRPAGDNETLLAYALQVELEGYPGFLVRNIIMDRLHEVLKAVRDEVRRRRK